MRTRIRIEDPELSFVRIDRVCRRLGVKPKTVWRWVKVGILPHPRRLPNMSLWKWSEIEAALEKRRG